MKHQIIAIIAALTVGNAAAQTATSDYQPGITAEGAVYFLPKTAIRVTAKIEKTTYQPGEFARFASRYLRLNDVRQQPETTYRIISIEQSPYGVADKTKGFAVKFNAKTVAANVSLTDDGRLAGINIPMESHAQSIAKGRTVNSQGTATGSKPQKDPKSFLTEEILAAGSTAKMAELTALEIYDIRENRNLLIKGQADFMPQDGSQMKLMLGQLDAQDEALTSLFAGTTVRDTTEQVVELCPDEPVQHHLLFRFSQRMGLLDKDDLAGTPYYINIDNLKTVPPVDAEAAAKNKKRQNQNGIYVNVPGRMRSTIAQGNTVINETEMPAAQFGNVELLSGELFNKRYTTHLWLDTTTGAVEKLDAEQPK